MTKSNQMNNIRKAIGDLYLSRPPQQVRTVLSPDDFNMIAEIIRIVMDEAFIEMRQTSEEEFQRRYPKVKSKHTPGPWKIKIKDHHENEEDLEIFADEIGAFIRVYDSPGNQMSNARLISAAPDMFSILKSLRHELAAMYESCEIPEEEQLLNEIDDVFKKVESNE